MDKPVAPDIAKDEPSFGEYVENWMTLYKVHTLKPTTLRGYRTMLTAHLLDMFGDMELRDIKPADIQKFLNSNKQLARSYLMVTGMRRGEALGLRWEDIDLSAGLIHIKRNVIYAKNQPFISTPKTAKGERDVPLNSMLLTHLEPIQQEGFIIGDTEPITRMSYRRRMDRIQATINLHGVTAHIFRHSYLTYAASLGTDVKTLPSIAGHADIQTTMNRYVHTQTTNIVEAGNRLQALFE